MPKQKSDFKKIIDESSVLINKLRAYEERIKEFDQSMNFLKSKSTISRIKKQLDNKDSIIKEFADAKSQLTEEIKEKNKLINGLRSQIKTIDSEIDNKDSKTFLLNQDIEKQNQIINEKDVKINQLTNSLQSLKRENNSNKDLTAQLKQELEIKSSALAKAAEEQAKETEQIEQFKLSFGLQKAKLKERDREILKLKEKAQILDATTQELVLKNEELKNDLLVLNQKISDKNSLIMELNKELEEKNVYYPALVDMEKQEGRRILDQTLKQNLRKELELKTKIKELEHRLDLQRQQLIKKTQKERAIIDDLRSKILEFGEFEEDKPKKRKKK